MYYCRRKKEIKFLERLQKNTKPLLVNKIYNVEIDNEFSGIHIKQVYYVVNLFKTLYTRGLKLIIRIRKNVYYTLNKEYR